MSSIVHKRLVAVSAPLSVATSDADAFGYSRIAVSHLERLREAEKSAAFEKVVKAAAKKLVKKRQNYKDFVKGRLPTLCAMGVREVRNVRRKISKKRKAFALCRLRALQEQSWHDILESMGSTGDPLVFAEPGALRQGHLVRKLGNKLVREYLASSIEASSVREVGRRLCRTSRRMTLSEPRRPDRKWAGMRGPRRQLRVYRGSVQTIFQIAGLSWPANIKNSWRNLKGSETFLWYQVQPCRTQFVLHVESHAGNPMPPQQLQYFIVGWSKIFDEPDIEANLFRSIPHAK